MIHATDTATTKDGETSLLQRMQIPQLRRPMVINLWHFHGDINRYADAGYPAGGQSVSDQVLENQNATTLDEALYTSVTWYRPIH